MKQIIPRGPMPQPTRITEKQETILNRLIRRSSSPQNLVLRARIVLSSAVYGRRNTQIARELDCATETAKTWRQRWLSGAAKLVEMEDAEDRTLEQAIIELLSDLPRPGAPIKFTAEQVTQIIAVACETPSASGRPITEWTPRELADEVVKRQIVESISPTQVGRFLKRGRPETTSEPVLAQQQTAREPKGI